MKAGFPASIPLAVLALALLSGCNKKQEDAPVPAAPEPPSATTTDPVAPVGISGVAQFSPYQIPADIGAGGNCALDGVDGHPVSGTILDAAADVRFGGWAADPQGKVPEGAVLVLTSAEGAYSVPLVGGGDRPDVAVALSNQDLAKSGFNIVGNIKGVKPGEYAVSVAYKGTPVLACQFKKSLTVAP